MPFFGGTKRMLMGGSQAPDEAETTALVARFTTPPSSARKTLINTLIKALKDGGVWTRLDALYVEAAADSQCAKLNWVQNAFNLTEVSAPTFVADRGYTGNGTTSYLQTGFNPTTASGKFAQDDAMLATYINVDVVEDKSDIGNTAAILKHNRGSAVIGIKPNAAATSSSGAIANGVGLSAWSRRDSLNVDVFRNGALVNTPSIASVAMSNDAMSILTNSSTPANGTTRRHCADMIGQSLSTTQMPAAWNALNAYMIAVGAN